MQYNFSFTFMRSFESLSEKEILALAISSEEEDARIYGDFAEGLRQTFPASAAVFEGMRQEESDHLHRLIELYRSKFGEHIPLIRRHDVKGFVRRRPLWLVRPLGLKAVRQQAATMEAETRHFYEKAATRTQDASIRQLLNDLAQEERSHEHRAGELERDKLQGNVREQEEEANRRLFVMQIVQPGLAGLMDGSVSTLAPVFAAAFAARAIGSQYATHTAFLVGLAASLGAGISMGFAEALSDDGSLTGRGHPWIRGLVCGLMTALGGIGHTLPFLIPDFTIAIAVAAIVVVAELATIAWVRHRYMESPILSATLQVVGGGLLVILAGWLIGQS